MDLQGNLRYINLKIVTTDNYDLIVQSQKQETIEDYLLTKNRNSKKNISEPSFRKKKLGTFIKSENRC